MSDDFIDHVRAQVRSHGVFLIHVHEDEDGPGWTYTVGLHALGHPEIVLFGPDQESAKLMLNDLAFRVVDGVERFDEPVVIEGYIGSPYEVAVLPFPAEQHDDHLGIAMGVAGEELTAVQLVVTGRDHRWPWEYETFGDQGSSAVVAGPVPDIASLARRPWTEHVHEVVSGVAYGTSAYLCQRVQTGEAPVLDVVHDHDDSWQLLCGGLHAGEAAGDDGIALGLLGRMAEHDPSLREVLDLPRGFDASRTAPGETWTRAAMPRRGLWARLRERFGRR
ncbi:DUF4262 domain-containing protein [Nocardioides zeae]|uniref:DUF4262 domain-containing protein n=1 Tax=Nocardioides zeae TaxID=1457234 RepID=A0A6P0HG81_9ACTN|nr:DUF4262 domain-containing protein [Nocardioides zeae]